MAKLKVTFLREGQHPSESMVSVSTANGSTETTIVDKDSFENGLIDIGYPVGSDEKRFLIELPRETLTGQWRIWVKRENVVGELINA